MPNTSSGLTNSTDPTLAPIGHDYALGGKAAWYLLILIGACQAMSMVDRQILTILMPKIKADLHIGDTEMGLLYGTVFALFYALFSLPLGKLADSWNRTKQLAISIIAWSGATALGGTANGFATLAVSRLGVGIGEASTQPAGMSILSDIFPKKMRGTVMALMAAAIALGLGAAIVVGGFVADAWDNRYIDATAPLDLRGWQVAFFVAAIPGILLGILLAFQKEPRRGLADGIFSPAEPHPFRKSATTLGGVLPLVVWWQMLQEKAPLRQWLINVAGLLAIILIARFMIGWTDSLRAINPPALNFGGVLVTGNQLQWGIIGLGSYVVLNWLQSLGRRDKPAFALIATSPSMIILIVLIALQTVINYGVMAFAAPFLLTKFELSAQVVGTQFGILMIVTGMLGPIIAGPLSDWANLRVKSGRLYVTVASLVIGPFLGLATFNAQTPTAFYAWFACYSVILTMWLPPLYATLMELVLPRMRGSVMSYYILTMTIFGMGLGPYAVGLMSDAHGGDLAQGIKNLYWLSPIIALLSVALLLRLHKETSTLVEKAKDAGEDL